MELENKIKSIRFLGEIEKKAIAISETWQIFNLITFPIAHCAFDRACRREQGSSGLIVPVGHKLKSTQSASKRREVSTS